MQTGLHRNTISKVYRQLETDGVVEAMAGSGIYVRDQQNPREIKPPPGLRHKALPDIDREVRQSVDGLLQAGCTLQQARDLITREIDWRLRCGARVLVSTPREDLGASHLIAEELTRLGSHLEQFRSLCAAPEPAGRKLDFLVQEMHREVNTTGSKSASASITGLVVQLKAELERVREQVQNVE
jgi:DNA-binding transcriptional regulator YhcF (GntR family)